MSKRIAASTLNASTIDILNVIRENASAEYYDTIPEVTQETDIPKVGEILVGHPALANQFINALVNRIAFVQIKSSTFNNPYKDLKKGYIELGESIEEIFVDIAKVRLYSPEKASEREFKRTIPDVKAAFHAMNWRAQYPITIQREDLNKAFVSYAGVEDLISRVIESVYKAAEYDEYLLFKYLIIKGVTSGKFKPVTVTGATETDSAIAFRATSNALTFMSRDYNPSNVLTNTPKDRQYIFMTAAYNAAFDVNVLASAFNMDKADFMGKLKLIDDFTSFDNARFAEIRSESTGLEEVTPEELTLMADVNAVIVDSDYFQVYDNLSFMSDTYVASGLYWNYFYNSWKTISYSPFANAVSFVSEAPTPITSVTLTVVNKDVNDEATVISLQPNEIDTLADYNIRFVQDSTATAAGVAVQSYGTYIIPASVESVTPVIKLNGKEYKATTAMSKDVAVGSTVTITIGA